MYIWIVNLCGQVSFPSFLSVPQCWYVSWVQPVYGELNCEKRVKHCIDSQTEHVDSQNDQSNLLKIRNNRITTFRLHTWWQCHLEVQLHTLHVMTTYNKRSYWHFNKKSNWKLFCNVSFDTQNLWQWWINHVKIRNFLFSVSFFSSLFLLVKESQVKL